MKRLIFQICALLCMTALLGAFAETLDLETFKNAGPGDVLSFGTFEQDSDAENGPEPISWRVLENDGNSLLLVSEFALDRQNYHSVDEPLTWETCELRAWLNGEFYENSFSESEKASILLTNLENPGSERYEISGGNPTQDHIFVLSTQELTAYFADEADMSAHCTPYAAARGVAQDHSPTPFACYWLRNPGLSENSAACMQYTFINYSGKRCAAVHEFAVRPALRIALNP